MFSLLDWNLEMLSTAIHDSRNTGDRTCILRLWNEEEIESESSSTTNAMRFKSSTNTNYQWFAGIECIDALAKFKVEKPVQSNCSHAECWYVYWDSLQKDIGDIVSYFVIIITKSPASSPPPLSPSWSSWSHCAGRHYKAGHPSQEPLAREGGDRGDGGGREAHQLVKYYHKCNMSVCPFQWWIRLWRTPSQKSFDR